MKENVDKIRHEQPKIRLGKKGITEGIVQEIDTLLKKDIFVKVKCLKSVPTESTRAIAQNIASLTNSKIIEIRGKTFILGKQNSK
ncbi:MAG: YhbY family RNA-binding protein [Candidatus Heimdallarchaeota archaeon]|nr:YhbY family RNA-binding protein [Candidatus Heimdallarchaeota archaeon]MCK4953974.1 YhbY family RNA-binding protein [Candidatus Heimdallarchaeota archaeon]